MISTDELRRTGDIAKEKSLSDSGQITAGKMLRRAADELDFLRERLTEQQNVHAHISTTLQHATEDKAKTLTVLQQLHMKRADPHDITQLLEFYLEAHLLIRNLLNGVPVPSTGVIPDIRRKFEEADNHA